MDNWFEIDNNDSIDTPALVFYPERIEKNINTAIAYVDGDVARLRPHVKTFKNADILKLYLKAGIKKVKTATIAETAMCAKAQIPDILLAFQPSIPKAQKLLKLVKEFPETRFSTLIDNQQTADDLNNLAAENNIILAVFIDVNVGMNRTGISVEDENFEPLLLNLEKHKNLIFRGFHVYDGHLKDKNVVARTETCGLHLEKLQTIYSKYSIDNTIEYCCGGSNTFPYYAALKNVTSCPGTFVLWDVNYSTYLPEQAFEVAALIIGRVVSLPSKNHVCLDLGYKAVASENPLENRLRVLNYPELFPTSHSEEHLVVKHEGQYDFKIGQIIYASPFHICPTVALYSTTYVCKDKQITETWHIANSRI